MTWKDDDEELPPSSSAAGLEGKIPHKEKEKQRKRELKKELLKLQMQVGKLSPSMQAAKPSPVPETFGTKTHVRKEKQQKSTDPTKPMTPEDAIRAKEQREQLKKLTPYESQQQDLG